jgi:hypothetical protein
MASVFKRNEIYLYDTLYPILKDVQKRLRPSYAQKMVFGDYTKDSERDKSSITFRDNNGGIGIKDMVETKHANRCWWSNCEIGYPGHLVPAPLATDCGNPTTAITNPAVMIEFNNNEYVAFGTDVRLWDETNDHWDASLKTLTAIPTDAIVHKSKLYFACGADFERLTAPSTWTTGTVIASGAKSSLFFLNWDEKLLRLSVAGLLSYSIDEGVTWTDNAQSNLAAGSFNSLFLMRNSSDQIVPHLGTTTGLYELDFDNAEWLDTGLTVPEHADACKGATMWRDLAAYIPVGMGIYQYITAANPTTINPMGPDRDYGIPSSYRGSVVKILSEHNALFALISSSGTTTVQNVFAAWPYWDSVIYDDECLGLLMKWNGTGWSVVKVSSNSVANSTPTGNIGTPDGNYRLWFSMEKKVWYIPLQSTLQNPLEIPDYAANASGEHIWGWFDADNAVVDKTAFNVTVYGEKLSATEYIQIYYGTDYDENTWTLLTNTTFADGKIDADGETVFDFASGTGVNFKAMRFKAILTRGTTTTKYPDLRWLRLEYMKIPVVGWDYTFIIDCSHDYRHKRASTLVTNLVTFAEAKTLGDFSYRTFNGTVETRKVRMLSMVGPEAGGKLKEGQYKIQLLAPND